MLTAHQPIPLIMDGHTGLSVGGLWTSGVYPPGPVASPGHTSHTLPLTVTDELKKRKVTKKSPTGVRIRPGPRVGRGPQGGHTWCRRQGRSLLTRPGSPEQGGFRLPGAPAPFSRRPGGPVSAGVSPSAPSRAPAGCRGSDAPSRTHRGGSGGNGGLVCRWGGWGRREAWRRFSGDPLTQVPGGLDVSAGHGLAWPVVMCGQGQPSRS